MNRFDLEGKQYSELIDAAQDAECKHAADDKPHVVMAVCDCEHGMFKKGEVVYTSKGGPGRFEARRAKGPVGRPD